MNSKKLEQQVIEIGRTHGIGSLEQMAKIGEWKVAVENERIAAGGAPDPKSLEYDGGMIDRAGFQKIIDANINEAKRLMNARVNSAAEAQANVKAAQVLTERATKMQRALASGLLENDFAYSEQIAEREAFRERHEWASKIQADVRAENEAKAAKINDFMDNMQNHAIGYSRPHARQAVEQLLAGDISGSDAHGDYVRFADVDGSPLRVYKSEDGKGALISG